MKPIDVQNAVLLALLCTSGRPSQLVKDLLCAGKQASAAEVARALETLRRDGLVQVLTEEYPAGDVSQPVYSITAIGIAEAGQLPTGALA